MTRTSPPTPYSDLATLITQGRDHRGLTQATLAAELGLKQQAVSRWEAGTHRPSIDQMPQLAAVLQLDRLQLMLLAGYDRPASLSVGVSFPVDALTPETFEHFVEAVIAAAHPEADVNLLGGRGHDQAGSDIVVNFRDGHRWSFQCKRVERFGKADVAKAIASHQLDAERKFLVLSKVASPAVIDAIAQHNDWTLWDKQVLSRKVRELPAEAQERLVDIFFRGQRMSLLGTNEPGPWLTPDEYFAPFEGRGAIFTHDWPLVGRDDDVEGLLRALASKETNFVLLIGAGGIGKTRILKEAVTRFAHDHRGTTVRFLSTAQEANAATLAALGGKPKLLVIDDAHDREGLKLLIEFAVNQRNNAKLLIASRPYAEQRIRNELAIYRIVRPPEIRLERLEKKALRKLIENVLIEFGGDLEWIDRIAEDARDSPLIAAMAARVVALEKKSPQLARGEGKLRDFFLARFTKVVTGDLGTPADTPLLRSLLEVLALIQPFHIDDRRVAELAERSKPGISGRDVNRGLKLLLDGGVLLKRGAIYRLMPDMLADFLIEESCIEPDGRLSKFAVTLAENVEGDRLTQVLVNLGRTDWRLSGGDPSNSQLLDPIWRKLEAIDTKYDGRIASVEAVAYYQPAQALRFVQAQIERGRILREFGNILKRVAYSPDYRKDALELLWALGKDRNGELNSDTSHPIRILAELVGYDRNRPVWFNEEVAEFGFDLIERSDAWTGRYTPLDILKPLLSGQGMETRSTGRAITLTPFFINYDVVAPLRARLIDRLILLLESKTLRAARHAARVLSDAVSAPYGLLNSSAPSELLQKYHTEFADTIARIGEVIERGTLAPTTTIALIGSLRWHADRGREPLRERVRTIFERLPNDLDFRFHAALCEGAEWTYVGQVPYTQWQKDKKWQAEFIDELLAAYPNRDALANALEGHLQIVEAAGFSTFPSHQIVSGLVKASQEFGSVLIEQSLERPNAPLVQFLGHAVSGLLTTDPAQGRALVIELLGSDEKALNIAGARGLSGFTRSPEKEDITLLANTLRSQNRDVAWIAAHALRMWRGLATRDVLPLVLAIDFTGNFPLFEEIVGILCHQYETFVEEMRPDELTEFLAAMRSIQNLNGYWTGELLTKLVRRHGMEVAQLVLDRATLALNRQEDDHEFDITGYERRRGGLQLHEAPDAPAILEYVWRWLREHDDIRATARYEIGETFSAMFSLSSPTVVSFLDRLIDSATVSDLEWIGHILGRAHHTFILTEHRLIERYLHRCKEVDASQADRATEQLMSVATTGSWSGTVGEPLPRDVEARDASTSILASMSRLSPAYRLYRYVLERAEQNIARSLADGAALDDEA